MKKLLVIKPPMDKDGFPTMDYNTLNMLTSKMDEVLPDEYNVCWMPFDSMFVVGEDDIDQIENIKIATFEDIEKVLGGK